MATKQRKQFKTVFRGYDPKEVDKFITLTLDQEATTRRAQRERIEELSEENYNIRERLAELQRAQNDVADALVTAQTVARDIEKNAKDYADKALIEAKKFYATWQAYSKTIIASFTEDELAAFSSLEAKIGDVIANYERRLKGEKPNVAEPAAEDLGFDEKPADADANAVGQSEDNAEETAETKVKPANRHSMSAADFVKTIERAAEDLTAEAEQSAKASAKSHANPIARVEQAAGQSIDLRELLRPEQSLEEICADLGLIESDVE